VAEPKQRGIFQVFVGDSLLAGSVGLLAALGDATEFPQDRAGIEALIGRLPAKPDGTVATAAYEEPGTLPTYRGAVFFWVAPAGEGRLRLREKAVGERLVSEVYVLGPDGSLSDPERIEGYGVPDEELTEAARGELAEIERRREEFLAREPERQRREEARRVRFRVEHLRTVIAGPPGQDPTGPIVDYVVLYDDGVIVDFVLPSSTTPEPEPSDPYAPDPEVPGKMGLDDGRGTEFEFESGTAHLDSPVKRGWRAYSPAPAPDAASLRVTIESTVVEVELRSA
jgi:hypothetical protein